MSKKTLALRRQKNHALGAQDAAHRCAFCRRELPKVGAVERFSDGKKFCNASCQTDQEIADALKGKP